MAEIEWTLGIFTIMAVMAAIIGGGTGIRLMYIDTEYRRMIVDKEKKLKKMRKKMGVDAKYINKNLYDYLQYQELLSNIGGKRDGNRRGLGIDASCMFIILGIGILTALGISPSLVISSGIAFFSFAFATILLHYHAQNVVGTS